MQIYVIMRCCNSEPLLLVGERLEERTPMTQDLLLLSYEENVYSTLYQRLSCRLQFVVLSFQCKAAPSTAPHMGPAHVVYLSRSR